MCQHYLVNKALCNDEFTGVNQRMTMLLSLLVLFSVLRQFLGERTAALVCDAGVTRVAQPIDDDDGRCQLFKREVLGDRHHWILTSPPGGATSRLYDSRAPSRRSDKRRQIWKEERVTTLLLLLILLSHTSSFASSPSSSFRHHLDGKLHSSLAVMLEFVTFLLNFKNNIHKRGIWVVASAFVIPDD